MVWRIENRSLEQKRNFLCRILNVDQWQKYLKRLKRTQRKRAKRMGAGGAQDASNMMYEELQ